MTPARGGTDEGMTLVELLVYIVLLGMILVVVSGFLVTSLRSQSVTINDNAVSNTTNVITRSMEAGIANASGISVESPTSWGQMVRVRTAIVTSSTVTWKCEAWYYSFTTGGFYQKTSSTMINDFTARPTFTGWTLVASGSGKSAGTVGLTRQTTIPTPGTTSVVNVFTPTGRGGKTVTVTANVGGGTQTPTTFTTTFGSQASPSPNPLATEAPTSCF
jgi:type II secretory pathway pseudopilin PulG